MKNKLFILILIGLFFSINNIQGGFVKIVKTIFVKFK